MGGVRQQLMAAVLVAVALMATAAEGYITQKTWGAIRRANRAGPFVGLVVPNTYEMVPVLECPASWPARASLTWTSKVKYGPQIQ